jgi:hypothetical protein
MDDEFAQKKMAWGVNHPVSLLMVRLSQIRAIFSNQKSGFISVTETGFSN